MSLEDDYKDFLTEDAPKPEDVFSMVTIMPRKKIKATAYLEDKDGDRLLVSEIAESLVSFITEQLDSNENTAVNSQLFPLCGQFMTSIVPRFVGMGIAGLLFQASGFRQALLTLSLASTLFMQYIEQHGLKIVTEITELSEEEVQSYLQRSYESEQNLREAILGLFDEASDGSEET